MRGVNGCAAKERCSPTATFYEDAEIINSAKPANTQRTCMRGVNSCAAKERCSPTATGGGVVVGGKWLGGKPRLWCRSVFRSLLRSRLDAMRPMALSLAAAIKMKKIQIGDQSVAQNTRGCNAPHGTLTTRRCNWNRQESWLFWTRVQ